uniref:Pentacotripeptide-repeat region of PRORP domain-containing protein n=1 Tax=Physcomitrium patens TaxID=3218 RepID=A0A7I4E4U3_PHYPA
MAVTAKCRICQHLLGWKCFWSLGSRNYAVLGLGRLQLGELPSKAMREWVPPADDPLPSFSSKKSGQEGDYRKPWRKFSADLPRQSDVRAQKSNLKQPDWTLIQTKESLPVESASTPSWVSKKIAAVSEAHTSPAVINALNEDEIETGDCDLQEWFAIKSREFQTKLLDADPSDDMLNGPYALKKRRRSRAVVGSDDDIRDLCLNGQPKNSLHILEQRGIEPSSYAYVCLLRRCTHMKDLAEGKYVHAHMAKSDFVPTTFVLNALVNMYMKCGSLVDARQVFDRMVERDMFTYTMMLTGYAKLGYPEDAYKMYEQMQKERVPVDRITFTTILNVCSTLRSLEKGMKVHQDMGTLLHSVIMKAGFELDVRVGTALVNMFSKCGSVVDALKVFQKLPQRNVVSWTSVISAYAQAGEPERALECYAKMLNEGMVADKRAYTTILNVCAMLGDIEKGKAVHGHIVQSGIATDIITENGLIDMYVKCGRLKDAYRLFQDMNVRDVVSWTTLIEGWVQHRQYQEALDTFNDMQLEGVMPNTVTFLGVLKACAGMGSLVDGKRIHARIVEAGLAENAHIRHALADMYAKCDSCGNAF